MLPRIVAAQYISDPIWPAVTYNVAGWTETVHQSKIQNRLGRLPKKKNVKAMLFHLRSNQGTEITQSLEQEKFTVRNH